MDSNGYVLVTGASSGIGREIAVQVSQTHKRLLLVGRNEKELQRTRQLLLPGAEARCWVYDLGKVESLERDLADFMTSSAISVAHFVHSAGVMRMMPLRMTTPEHFHSALNVNLVSAAIMAKVLTSRRVNRGTLRSIVFISSNLSRFGAKAMAAYGATKGGLDTMMRCLAVELAPAVRVNSVLPGGIPTEMTAEMYRDTELAARMERDTPLGLGSTKDIADAVIFLLSDRARWVTGQQLTVDGGRTVNISG